MEQEITKSVAHCSSTKKAALRNFTKFIGKHLSQSLLQNVDLRAIEN